MYDPYGKLPRNLSVGELSYIHEKRNLEVLMPEEDHHVLEGVLYYRLKSKANTGKKDDSHESDQKTHQSARAYGSRQHTSLLLSQLEKKSNSIRNFSSSFTSCAMEEDSMEPALDEDDIKESMRTNTARVRQAMQSRFYGYDFNNALLDELSIVDPRLDSLQSVPLATRDSPRKPLSPHKAMLCDGLNGTERPDSKSARINYSPRGTRPITAVDTDDDADGAAPVIGMIDSKSLSVRSIMLSPRLNSNRSLDDTLSPRASFASAGSFTRSFGRPCTTTSAHSRRLRRNNQSLSWQSESLFQREHVGVQRISSCPAEMRRQDERRFALQNQRRSAQDVLLLNQLENGIIPEDFIERRLHPAYLAVDVSNFGIGDSKGICLGRGIRQLESLTSLGLRDNRLTGESLPVIIKNISVIHIKHIDLSCNMMHGPGAEALASFLSQSSPLEYLDTSRCALSCDDISRISRALMVGRTSMNMLILNCNNIGSLGAHCIAELISKAQCEIVSLEMSWNHVGAEGAAAIAQALKTNKNLNILELAANNIRDAGAQEIASALVTNKALSHINIQQNSIGARAVFVFSQVLKVHKQMKLLNLCRNPIGSAGARDLFRTKLNGRVSCEVKIDECTYAGGVKTFNYDLPALDSPYVLDLKVPFDSATLTELLELLKRNPDTCKFESVHYREGPRAPEQSLNLVMDKEKGDVVLKSSGQKWVPPAEGKMTLALQHSVAIPTVQDVAPDSSFDILESIMVMSSVDEERKTWLMLMGKELYCTTQQVQRFIDRLIHLGILGMSGINIKHIIVSFWSGIIDSENKYDFFCKNVRSEVARREVIYAMKLEKFRFDWKNPTGHWRLDLALPTSREVMNYFVALNNAESEFGKTKSGREDTSQKNNWFNFRNETYDLQKDNFVFTKEFLSKLPNTGILEFDYVSTTRPQKYASTRTRTPRQISVSDMLSATAAKTRAPNDRSSRRASLTSDVGDDFTTFSGEPFSLSSSVAGSLPGSIPQTARSIENAGDATPPGHVTMATEKPDKEKHKFISSKVYASFSEEEFDGFMNQLGLTEGIRIHSTDVLLKLAELQVAVTKFYLPATYAVRILDAFPEDDGTQSRVVVCFFSRVYDLYNFDIILRKLSRQACYLVFKCLGVMNIMNPLKPSFDYVLPMNQYESRHFIVLCLKMSYHDGGDNIKDDPKSELPLVNLYGWSDSRIRSENRDCTLRFRYCDVGERTNLVAWKERRDMVKYFLVGSQPQDPSMYKIQAMYKELEAQNVLRRGPIEIQYQAYAKASREKKKAGKSGKGEKLPSIKPPDPNRRPSRSSQGGRASGTSADAGVAAGGRSSRLSSASLEIPARSQKESAVIDALTTRDHDEEISRQTSASSDVIGREPVRESGKKLSQPSSGESLESLPSIDSTM